jgi:hypothetical protein
MMAQFVGFSPDVEVNGETVYAIVDGMGTFRSVAFAILAENGIDDPRPGAWFPQQYWLNAFKKIAEKLGENTLYNIGLKIPTNAQFPTEIETIHDALQAIDVAYHLNHRNGEIGEYCYQNNGEHSAKMICRNPYPCAFDRGIIAAMANRFKPKGATMIYVKHDDNSPCRVAGAESCTYNVTW